MTGDTPGTDWVTIRRRMDEAAERTARGWEKSAGEVKRVLHERARLLAQVHRLPEGEETLSVLEFMVGPNAYGMETQWVKEVVPSGELAPVPCTPPFVLGLMNIRGRLLSVTDLRAFLELPFRTPETTAIIVTASEVMEIGIAADAILGVTPRPLRNFQAPSGGDGGYIKMITTNRMTLLDMEALLRDRRLVVNDEVR